MTAPVAARALELCLDGFHLGPVELELGEGEYLVLVGPSGAGKTVLLETLVGWYRPAAGAALLDGRPAMDLPPAERSIAYVPQDLGLLPHLGVRANLTWGIDCRGAQAAPDLLATLVEVLGLGDLLGRADPRTLSRGEQQRVVLGRALLTRPRRLFLDEPCAALDPHLRREFQLLLRRLHREHGTTVLHITHDREEAFLLGDRVGVLLGGRLRQVAPPEELYDGPADAAVARFLAPENLWPGGACEGGRHVCLTEAPVDLRVDAPLPAGAERLLVGLRPEEAMVLHPDRPLRPQVAENVVSARVDELLFLDGVVQATMVSAEGLRVVTRMPVCRARELGLTVGADVRVSLKAGSLYVLGDE